MSGGDAMTTQATADLVAEVQALIREREREGVLGLAELIGPAEWADLVPQLEPNEVTVLIPGLPAPSRRAAAPRPLRGAPGEERGRCPGGAPADRGRSHPAAPVRPRGRRAPR